MNHSIGVTLKFTDFATGLTDRPRTPRGDLIGRNHRSALRSSADAAQAAWASADMTRSCQLPFGTFSADMAAGINLFDVLAHTWDIAKVTGLCIECTDDVWSDGLHAAQMVIGPNRDLRYYGPELVSSTSASPMERLLAFLGRSHVTCP